MPESASRLRFTPSSIAHELWRLSRSARRRLLYGAIDLIAPRLSPLHRTQPGPTIVGGLLTTASGLGESARLCLDALCALGMAPHQIDLSTGFLRSDLPYSGSAPQAAPSGGGTLILHINGPYMPYAAMRMRRHFLKHKKIIGYWAWELPKMGPDWRRGLPYVHEIWTPAALPPSPCPGNARAGPNRPPSGSPAELRAGAGQIRLGPRCAGRPRRIRYGVKLHPEEPGSRDLGLPQGLWG